MVHTTKNKDYIDIAVCLAALRVEKGLTQKDILDMCVELEPEFRKAHDIPTGQKIRITGPDLTRVKKYTHLSATEATNVSKHKWRFLHYVLARAGHLTERDIRGPLSHDTLYYYFVQHLHNSVHADEQDIRLFPGTYLLRRFSYLQKGMISTSRLEIEKSPLPGITGKSYYTYYETKKAAQGGRNVYTGAKGYIIKSLQNYILIGTTKFSQTDPGGLVAPEEDHFTDFMILKPTSNIQRLRGVTLGVIRDSWTPFATRVDVEFVNPSDYKNIDHFLGISKPTKEEARLIENQIDSDGWGVLLPD